MLGLLAKIRLMRSICQLAVARCKSQLPISVDPWNRMGKSHRRITVLLTAGVYTEAKMSNAAILMHSTYLYHARLIAECIEMSFNIMIVFSTPISIEFQLSFWLFNT